MAESAAGVSRRVSAGTITSNLVADGNGGGIAGTALDLVNSTFHVNRAATGGGLCGVSDTNVTIRVGFVRQRRVRSAASGSFRQRRVRSGIMEQTHLPVGSR